MESQDSDVAFQRMMEEDSSNTALQEQPVCDEEEIRNQTLDQILAKVSSGMESIDTVSTHVDAFMKIVRKYNYMQVIGFVIHAIKAETTKSTLANLYLALSLLFPNSTRDMLNAALSFYTEAPEMLDHLKAFLSKVMGPIVGEGNTPEITSATLTSVKLEASDTMQDILDSVKGIQNPTKDSFTIGTHAHTLISIVIMIATAAGFGAVASKLNIQGFLGDLSAISNILRSWNAAKGQLSELTNTILKTGCDVIGYDYVDPKLEKARQISRRVVEFREQLTNIITRMQCAAFKEVTSESLQNVNKTYNQVLAKTEELTSEEKSMYNVHNIMQTCWQAVEQINKMRMVIIDNVSGKQEPVVLWVGGPTNVGKSTIINKLSDDLNKELGFTKYDFSAADKYWSGYQGQSITNFDDMNQRRDNSDHDEFMKTTTGACYKVNMAAVEDKGRAFTSTIITASSNCLYVTDSKTVTHVEAINRRRNLVLFAYNPHVSKELACPTGKPLDELFAEHPTQYFVVDENWGSYKTPPAIGNMTPEHPCVCGPVSYDQVKKYVVCMHAVKTEQFRQKLIMNGVLNDDDSKPTDLKQSLDFINNFKLDYALMLKTRMDARNGILPPIKPRGAKLSDWKRASSTSSIDSDENVNSAIWIEPPKKAVHPNNLNIRPKDIKGLNFKFALQTYHAQWDKIENWFRRKGVQAKDFGEEILANDPEPVTYKLFDDPDETQMLLDKLGERSPFWCDRSGGTKREMETMLDFMRDEDNVSPWTYETIRTEIFMRLENVEQLETFGLHHLDLEMFIEIARLFQESLVPEDLTARKLEAVQDMFPTKTMMVGKRLSLLFHGAPQTGKTFSLLSLEQRGSIVRGPPLGSTFDEVSAFMTANVNRVIWFDDITTSIEMFGHVFQIVHDYYEGNTRLAGIIMTANTPSAITEDSRWGALYRRSIPFKFALRDIRSIIRRMLKNPSAPTTTQEMLERIEFQAEIINEDVKALLHDLRISEKKMNVRQALTCAAEYTKFVGANVYESKVVGPIVVPYATFDLMADAGVTFLEATSEEGGIKVQHVLKWKYYKCENGQTTPTSICSYLHLLPVLKGMVNENFVGSIEEAAMQITECKIKCDIPTFVLRFTDMSIGLATVDGVIVAFLVRENNFPHALEINADCVRENDSVVYRDLHNDFIFGLLDKLQIKSFTPDSITRRTEMMAVVKPKMWISWVSLLFNVCDLSLSFWSLMNVNNGKPALPAPQPDPIVPEAPKIVQGKESPDAKLRRAAHNLRFESAISYVFVPMDRSSMDIEYEGEIMTLRRGKSLKIGDEVFLSMNIDDIPTFTTWMASAALYAAHLTPDQVKAFVARATQQGMDVEVYHAKEEEELDLESLPYNFGDSVENDGTFGIRLDSTILTVCRDKVKDKDIIVEVPLSKDWKFHRKCIDPDYCKTILPSMVGKSFPPKQDTDEILVAALCYPSKLHSTQYNFVVELFEQFELPEALRAVLPTDLLKKSVSLQSMRDPALTDILTTMQPSYYKVFSKNDTFLCYAINIVGSYFVSVGHAKDDMSYVRRWNCTTKIDILANVNHDEVRDVLIFKVSDNRVNGRNIVAHFMPNSDYDTMLASRSKNVPVVLQVPNTITTFTATFASMDVCKKPADDALVPYSAHLAGMMTTGISHSGYCGLPLYVFEAAFPHKILGIHRAGSSSSSYYTPISSDYLLRHLKGHMNYNLQSDMSYVLRETEDYECLKEPMIHSKYGVSVIGHINTTRFVPETTKLHPTGLTFGVDVEPAVLTSKDPRWKEDKTPYSTPMEKSVSKYTAPPIVPQVSHVEMIETADEIADHITQLLAMRKKDVRVLSQKEAINAAHALEYPAMRPLDGNGSVGYPYTKMKSGFLKKDYLTTGPDGMRRFADTPDAIKIREDTDLLMQDSRRGTYQNILHTANLKDELLPLRKTRGEDIKTRTFFAGPMHYLLVFRMLFLALLSRITELHELIPIKVGITPDAMGWTKLYSYMTEVGFRGFDADFSGFDSTITPMLMSMPIRVYNKIYTALDTTTTNIVEDNTARSMIHSYIEGAHVLVGKLVIKLVGRQISGQPATAVDNSICVWVMYVMAWKQCMRDNGKPEEATFASFCKYVRLCIYGDDNVCIVAEAFVNLFTFRYVQKYFTRVGMVMSTADKTISDSDVRPISDLTFLKRNFVLSNNMCMGALPLDAILKSISWIRSAPQYVYSGTFPVVRDLDSLNSNLEGSMPELARHGPEVYAKYRTMILEQCAEQGLEIEPLPSYQCALRGVGYI